MHLLQVHDLRAVDWSDTNMINTTEYDLYITQEYKPNAAVVLAAVNNNPEINHNNNSYRNNFNPPPRFENGGNDRGFFGERI